MEQNIGQRISELLLELERLQEKKDQQRKEQELRDRILEEEPWGNDM